MLVTTEHKVGVEVKLRLMGMLFVGQVLGHKPNILDTLNVGKIGKVKGSPNSVRLIVWGLSISVPNFEKKKIP